MTITRGVMIGLILAFVTGCITGLAIGGYRGYRAGTALILNEALSKDAREVISRIAILKQLRAEQRDQAIDSLETGLADILIGFDPDEPYTGLQGQTMAELKRAIDEARDYWSAHPRRHADFRDKMIENLFAHPRYK